MASITRWFFKRLFETDDESRNPTYDGEMEAVSAYYNRFDHSSDERFNLTPLDGDYDKVTNPDQSVDVGINPPLKTHAFRCGRAVDPTHLPRTVRAKGRKRALPDYISISQAQIVSPKFRDVVESLEPDTHQFEGVTIVWKDGTEAGRHFWFIPCVRRKTLHEELIYPPINYQTGNWTTRGPDKKHVPDPRFLFEKEPIRDLTIWCDAYMNGFIAVSEEFRAKAEEAGVSGVVYNKKEVA